MRNLDIIILAAGFGKRTHGILNGLPKSLILTSDGKTILDHLIDDLVNKCKLSQINLITNSLFFNTINSYLKTKYPMVDITVLDNQILDIDKKRGALGDLLFSIDMLKLDFESLLVLPSDTAYWSSFSLREFIDFSYKNANFSTIVRDVKDKNIVKNRFGCATLNIRNEITSFIEKPENPLTALAASPFYMYRKKHISLLRQYVAEKKPLDSPGFIIPYLLEKGEVIKAFVVDNQIVDAGVPADIQRVAKY